MVIALVWLAAVILTLALPGEFRSAGYIIAGWFVLSAIWYFAALRRRLSDGVAAIGLNTSPASRETPRMGSRS
jgi:hypothetical protein